MWQQYKRSYQFSCGLKRKIKLLPTFERDSLAVAFPDPSEYDRYENGFAEIFAMFDGKI